MKTLRTWNKLDLFPKTDLQTKSSKTLLSRMESSVDEYMQFVFCFNKHSRHRY